jgi:hypothetical protein
MRTLILIGVLFIASPSYADPTSDAYRICKAMGNTGMTTDCSVDGREINVTIDTTGAEARKICASVVDLAAQVGANFEGRWKLRILSPYSGSKAIAVCNLK